MFGIRYRLPEDIFKGATDVHCHLLPGVDDGFSSTEKSLQALKKLEERGVKNMILTPHFMKDYPLNNRESITAEFESFIKEADLSRDQPLCALKSFSLPLLPINAYS